MRQSLLGPVSIPLVDARIGMLRQCSGTKIELTWLWVCGSQAVTLNLLLHRFLHARR